MLFQRKNFLFPFFFLSLIIFCQSENMYWTFLGNIFAQPDHCSPVCESVNKTSCLHRLSWSKRLLSTQHWPLIIEETMTRPSPLQKNNIAVLLSHRLLVDWRCVSRVAKWKKKNPKKTIFPSVLVAFEEMCRLHFVEGEQGTHRRFAPQVRVGGPLWTATTTSGSRWT